MTGLSQKTQTQNCKQAEPIRLTKHQKSLKHNNRLCSPNYTQRASQALNRCEVDEESRRDKTLQ